MGPAWLLELGHPRCATEVSLRGTARQCEPPRKCFLQMRMTESRSGAGQARALRARDKRETMHVGEPVRQHFGDDHRHKPDGSQGGDGRRHGGGHRRGRERDEFSRRKGINRPRGQRLRHGGDDLRHRADRGEVVTVGAMAATSVFGGERDDDQSDDTSGRHGTASVLVATPGGANAANTLFTYVTPAATVTITGTNPTGAQRRRPAWWWWHSSTPGTRCSVGDW